VLASAYAPGQHGWRRCNNCRGMFWALLPGSVCTANGAAHNGTGSSDYAVNLHSDEPALPAGFPDTWVAQNARVGNSTDSRYEDGTQPPNLPPPLYGAVANQVVTFNPADPNGKDQKVLNLFYFCCYMHDYFYCSAFVKRTATSRPPTSTGAASRSSTACRGGCTRSKSLAWPTS
jgi:hypothetical protein